MRRTIMLLLCLVSCESEELGYAPPVGHPESEESSEGREDPSLCPAYINCRETCGVDDSECRLECAEVVKTDHQSCIDQRCAELTRACAVSPGRESCTALPRCDNDVLPEAGSTSEGTTGGSSSGTSEETGGSSDLSTGET